MDDRVLKPVKTTFEETWPGYSWAPLVALVLKQDHRPNARQRLGVRSAFWRLLGSARRARVVAAATTRDPC